MIVWDEKKVDEIVEKIVLAKSWSARVQAFEKLNEVLVVLATNETNPSQSIMKKILQVHVDYLSDSHFRVASACLDSLITLVSIDCFFVEHKLDFIVPKVTSEFNQMT